MFNALTFIRRIPAAAVNAIIKIEAAPNVPLVSQLASCAPFSPPALLTSLSAAFKPASFKFSSML